MIALKVNGEVHQLDVEPDMPLLWVLREQLKLTGTKYSCGIATCGACIVHLDGFAATSCTLRVGDVHGREVTTIEGLAPEDRPHPVQEAWVAEDVSQCGYCQSGLIMAAAALLKRTPNPSDADIDGISNICRCGTYQRVRRAIHRAAAVNK